MNILIIGNSHVIALEAVLKHINISDYANLDFIAAAGGQVIEHYDFTSMTVKAKDKNALAFDIKNLDEYDVIFVYGLRLRSWADGTKNWLRLLTEASAEYLSAAVKQQMFKDYVTDSAHCRALQLLGKLNLLDRVISVPSPLPIERESNFQFKNNDLRLYESSMAKEIQKLGVKFLNTPSELNCDNGIFTKRLYKTSRDDDFNHIDEVGGKIVLKLFVENAYELKGRDLDKKWSEL
ncbi:hypothetical protein [Agaribacter marinus]|uniref:Uncharacterized protein n=1 Tax=Agaribacter marinus TaxID=1431249 RepID=A0AA37WIB2_9ALTE|nr:hypothetical protein [Agaribacter marinus]GLR70863.1 hypothetical protein GCM10007852_17710 [Agaribacter marinus]